MWTLFDDLDAFYLEHRRCGRLDSGVEGERVWMSCDCGAGLSRLSLVECRALADPAGSGYAPATRKEKRARP